MAKRISEIEGIGPSSANKLGKAGVKSVNRLLEIGASKKGRKSIAEKSGINESTILKWVNMADLFRVKGVGQEYAELLEAAGVDTVKELRNRNAANLNKKMEEVNEKKKLVRLTPGVNRVGNWIEHAKQLQPKVTY